MKLIIAGGRDYELTDADFARLDALAAEFAVTEVVSGTARGADSGGERWAESRGIPVRRFPPDWRIYGRRAGPVRNGLMAAHANALVAFPGGTGTADMVAQATTRGLRIFDWRVRAGSNGEPPE